MSTSKISLNFCHDLRSTSTQNVQQGRTVKRQENIGTATRLTVMHVSDLGLRQLPCGFLCVRSSAVETNSVSGRQMAQPYLKSFGELAAF